MQTWWAAPIGRAAGDGAVSGPLTQGRFTQLIFASHGITLALALALTGYCFRRLNHRLF